MTNDRNNQSVQSLTDELDGLLGEAEIVSKDIDETNDSAKKELDSIEKDVSDSESKLETIFSELDKAEEEAGNELDKLILQEAEDLADEEE